MCDTFAQSRTASGRGEREIVSSICQAPKLVIFTSIQVAASGATRVCKLALSATRTKATR